MNWVLVVTGIYLVSACWHILYGGMNSDEGFYAIAARSVWQGDLPYRDFGYTQMPLLPYINGLLMQLTGFGLFEQRAVNGLWGALTLLIGAFWLARRTSVYWALGLVVLFSFSAPWMYFIHLGKTYAFAGLTTIVALWIYTEWNPGLKKITALALVATLGVGCRLPMAPYFGVLWVATLVELPGHSGRDRLLAVGISLLWPLLLILPFYCAAPDAAIFWTVDFFRASVPVRAWRLPWLIIVTLAPALWLGLAGYFVQLALRPRLYPPREIIAAIATTLCLAANLLPKGAFAEYAVPLLPALAVILTLGLWHGGALTGRLRQPAIPFMLVLFNLGATAILQWPLLPLERRDNWSLFLPLTAPAYDHRLPQAMAEARAVVQKYLQPDHPLIGPMIILAAETGRPVPPGLRMGASSATVEFDLAKAQSLNLSTLGQVESYLTDRRIPLLALSKNPYDNYICSMPTFQNLSRYKKFSWNKFLQSDFLIAYEDTNFFLLVRRTTATAITSRDSPQSVQAAVSDGGADPR